MTGRGLGEARYWREETGQGKKAAEAVCRREPEVTFPLAGPTRRFWDGVCPSRTLRAAKNTRPPEMFTARERDGTERGPSMRVRRAGESLGLRLGWGRCQIGRQEGTGKLQGARGINSATGGLGPGPAPHSLCGLGSPICK